MINLYTKFEVSNYTHYENMTGGANCTTWSGLGGYGSLKVISSVVYLILMKTMHLSCTVFEI